jgi:hypothetical protein
MSKPPTYPKIYHITHLDNLASMLADSGIQSDFCRIKQCSDNTNIGMSEIKRRRLEELDTHCHPGTKVGQYVPFYFCPRSIMLYILHKGNHPDITYHGGQTPIIHLQSDLRAAVKWADQNRVRWAFSDRNAGTYLAQFYNRISDLDKINWTAVNATNFQDMMVKEGKQAEFLMYHSFPLSLVEKVGVINTVVKQKVDKIINDSGSNIPLASIEHQWYF